MTYTVETIIVTVPHKADSIRRRCKKYNLDTVVVTPCSTVLGHRARFMLLDEDLKHEWDFHIDQWYHEQLLLRVHPDMEYFGWVREV